jgi:hypothetical protein
MKFATSGFKVCLCILLFLLAPGLMFASSATVDCIGVAPGTFTTITAALATMSPTDNNFIFVTCNPSENVVINNFTSLSIDANPGTATVIASDPNRRVLFVNNSTDVFIDGVNFLGGRGVFINNSGNVQLGDGFISNSTSIGLTSLNSNVTLFGSSPASVFTIENSTRSGISADGGSLSLDGVSVTNNLRFGVSMVTGHLFLNGGDGGVTIPDNIISNNNLVGLQVADTAECDAGGGNSIINNGGNGLNVIHTSTIIWGGGGTISGNNGVGVHIGETSHGEFDTVNITGNSGNGVEITDHSDGYFDGGVNSSSNTGIGVLVDMGSVLNSLGGNTVNNNHDDGYVLNALSVLKFAANDTVTGNTALALECNNGSLVIGDISTYKPKKCGTGFQANPLP